ncbi:phage tail-like protein [Neolewinella xylanilytica]|uniref:Phage tail-like protein n=1 Tax=Neolewinella xylanilytica TaxID=1514080 RepID=A0A2S6I9A5_9BACT|nr:phage tail protein [Neolewinella xylanilytica]PPK88075.1 phage tail-like protein [Neolewinella xylanilytica]
MKPGTANYQPPVGFFYSVEILGEGESPFPPIDASFQEVSGINVTMEVTSISEGGQNRFAHKVPAGTTYDNLVLKRGLVLRSSSLADWCIATLQGGMAKAIKPKLLKVSLLDAGGGQRNQARESLVSWIFTNAYPVKWELSGLTAQRSELVIETISFAYGYFDVDHQPAAKSYPHSSPS